jgi:hypothetical protein
MNVSSYPACSSISRGGERAGRRLSHVLCFPERGAAVHSPVSRAGAEEFSRFAVGFRSGRPWRRARRYGDSECCAATLLIGSDPRLRVMRRPPLALITLYVLTAAVTTALEAAGVGRQCGCRTDCRCERPGLRLFRWVAPIGDSSVDVTGKAQRA